SFAVYTDSTRDSSSYLIVHADPQSIYMFSSRRSSDLFNGILWIARSGARWEDLPARYGPHQTVYSCFCRWRDDGTPAAKAAVYRSEEHTSELQSRYLVCRLMLEKKKTI